MLIKKLKQCFCKHNWIEIYEKDVNFADLCVYMQLYKQCTKCGKKIKL